MGRQEGDVGFRQAAARPRRSLQHGLQPGAAVLATGGDDELIRLWNVEFWDVGTRQRIGQPIDISDPWSEMAFSTDGGELAVVGPDGDARLVDTSVASWEAIACVIANRGLYR